MVKVYERYYSVEALTLPEATAGVSHESHDNAMDELSSHSDDTRVSH